LKSKIDVKNTYKINTYPDFRNYAKQEDLVYPNLVKTDWLFKTILHFEKKNTYLISSLIITIFLVATILSGIIENLFLNDNLEIDMLHDIGFWMIIIVDYALTFLSIHIFRNTAKMFIQLYHSGMIKTEKPVFNAFFTRINKKINSKILILLCYAIGIGIFIYQYLSMPLTTINTWHIPDILGHVSITSLVFIPLNLFHQILIIQFLIRTVATSIILISFFLDHRLQINFTQKKQGVDSPIEIIGKYAFVNFLMIFMFSLFLAASLFSNTQIYGFAMYDTYNIILITEFVLCSFASIFSPLLLLI
jgi:hypothetical protein